MKRQDKKVKMEFTNVNLNPFNWIMVILIILLLLSGGANYYFYNRDCYSSKTTKDSVVIKKQVVFDTILEFDTIYKTEFKRDTVIDSVSVYRGKVEKDSVRANYEIETVGKLKGLKLQFDYPQKILSTNTVIDKTKYNSIGIVYSFLIAENFSENFIGVSYSNKNWTYGINYGFNHGTIQLNVKYKLLKW